MTFDTKLSRNELKRMVEMIAPTWEIREATPAEAGHHAVYRLTVETPAGGRDCYLKATPERKDPSVNLEARLLAVLDRHTKIPVPRIHGVVDEHDDLPAPFVLVDEVPGERRPRTELRSLSEESFRTVASETGRHLADLHSLDAVDAYGFLTADGPTLCGGRPSGGFDTIAVADPIEDWRVRLHEWADTTLENLETTRFGDVASEAEPVIRSRIDGIEGPFEPVLARIDQSLENVVVDGDEPSAMLDWEFTIASTPAYDVVAVSWNLAGGPYLFAPETSDRRDLVRNAVLDGYRKPGTESAVEHVRTNRGCYELLSALRSMVHLENWFRLFDLDGRVDDAASNLREDVLTRL